jgi:multidrug efflux pump
VSQRLAQVDGVGDVEIGGSTLPAVRVELLPFALNRYGISGEDVRAAIQARTRTGPRAGRGRGPASADLHPRRRRARAADYAPMVVAWRNGAAVRLQDVAEVVDGVENTAPSASFNGQPAVIVLVTRQPAPT